MKALWLLAAAIAIGACANRSEDEVGAVPEQADSADVAQGVDTATYTPPSTAAGRTESLPTDSAQGQRTSPAPSNETSGTPSESVPTDSAQGHITAPAPTNEAFELSGDSAEVDQLQGDSALTGHGVPTADSTAGQPQQ